tara:strand:+ start:113 stop:1606 length:1494 start_codon:yes stop_codon:yes gene_type:complete
VKNLFENWNIFLNEVETNRSASDILQNWEHEDAANYAQELIDDYGDPDVSTNNMFLWKGGISEFTQTYVKDESIPHCCPKPHKDFVYSTMIIDIPEDLMEAVAKASESIIVDQLKNEVTARCGDIYANAITLGFVQKLVAGDIKPEDSKEEYEKHILEGMLPDWFEEKVEEGKKKKKKGGKKDACYHKVKSRYDVWPSAYASGALVKCRKVGAKNWGKKSSKKEGVESQTINLVYEEVKDKPYRTDAQAKEDINPASLGLEEEVLGEEGLRDWFGKSKSKGGKPGWVQVVSGKPCARQPGQKTTPKCVSSAKRASMTKKERESAQRRKRKADPGQPKKSDAAKPTYVKTDKKEKKKTKKESIDMSIDKKTIEELLNKIIQEEVQHLLNETEEYYHITEASYDDGTIVEELEFWDDILEEAEYQGRKVTLNKPMKGDVKKSKVYVKNAKGNVVKVNFGDKKMRIKKSNPKRRKSFRARHNCKNPGPKWKARYWSCKAW